jgi:hypothetical protein
VGHHQPLSFFALYHLTYKLIVVFEQNFMVYVANFFKKSRFLLPVHYATKVRALATMVRALAIKVRALATKVSFDYQGKLWPPWYELCIKLRAIKVRALPTK